MNEPSLREEVLAAISGGDCAFERELLARFLALTDADAAQLEAAIRERARERVAAIAHLIQGRCKVLGAMTVAHAGEDLERAASREGWGEIDQAHARVHQELAVLGRVIRQRLP